jgi:hypothetical protein
MAIRNYDIGGMLARSGESIGQQISQGADKFGEGIGGLITGVGTGVAENIDRRTKEKTAEEVQKLLQQNANNPAQLNALGQKHQSEGNNDIANMFFDAAKAATAKEATGQQRGVQGGLAAITQAASRDVSLADLKEAQSSVLAQGGTNEQIMKAYKDGLELNKKPEAKDLSLTTETIAEIDPETGETVNNMYRVGSNKQTGATESRVFLGVDPDQGASGSSDKSISQMMVEAGFPEEDIDLTTIEGLQAARAFVVDNVQNASLANTLTSMIEEKTPPGVGDAFELLVKVDPEFVSAQEDVARVEKFKALSELSSEDMSGLKNLLERVVSGTTESDVRAVSELQQFRGDKDLINKFNDFVLGVTSGRLSQETIQEYGTIMEVVGALAKKHQINTLDALIVYGSARESEAASKALDFITRGEGTARVIPNS